MYIIKVRERVKIVLFNKLKMAAIVSRRGPEVSRRGPEVSRRGPEESRRGPE